MLVPRFLSALVFLLAVTALVGADDAKPEADKPEKLVSLGEVSGVLKTTAGSQAGMSIQVTLRYLEVNAGAEANLVREQQDILNRQRQILRTRNPVQRRQQLIGLLQEVARLQQSQQNLFHIKEVHQDIELQPADNLKVRTLNPPVVFDEKGFAKKYTPQELKEMRGDGKLPGYAAEMDALHSGQVVTAFVARKRTTGKKDEEEKDSLTDSNKPLATLIVILADPQAGK